MKTKIYIILYFIWKYLSMRAIWIITFTQWVTELVEKTDKFSIIKIKLYFELIKN